jgi:hypothetical protein
VRRRSGCGRARRYGRKIAADKEGVCDVAANADDIVTGCVLANSASACGSKEAPAARVFMARLKPCPFKGTVPDLGNTTEARTLISPRELLAERFYRQPY